MKVTSRVLLLGLVIGMSSTLFASDESGVRCEKEGEIAQRASELRIAGNDKESAIQVLLNSNQESADPLTEQNVRGLVTVSYMAKMKPAKMRDYAVDQCQKNELK